MRLFSTACTLAAIPFVIAFSPSHAQPGVPPNDPDSWTLAGTAKILCSSLFVSGRDESEARAHLTSYFLGRKVDSITKVEVDRQRKLVRLTLADRVTREAKLYGDQGCVIHQPGRDTVFFTPVRVTTTLPDASTMSWPMGDRLERAPLPPGVDSVALRQAVDAAFATPSGLTAAFLVVHKGHIIAERYANGANKDMQLESWSMGKSIVGTLVGILVQQGAIQLDDPAPIPEWRKTPGDPRAKIRVIDLMRMSSGLRFSRGSPEDIPGYHDHDLGYTGAIDAFAFATSRPLQFEPNTFGRYRNSDPLALGMIVRDVVRNRGDVYLTWPQRALFDKIGIRRQVLETDPYGNFLLNGYDYGTARNWARLGLLYLNDGVWQGQRLLPEGWTTFVSTPAPAWKDSSYGAMVWVNAGGTWGGPLPRDAFAFRGAGLQDTYIVRSRDLVVVRMGHFPGARDGAADLRRALELLMKAIPGRKMEAERLGEVTVESSSTRPLLTLGSARAHGRSDARLHQRSLLLPSRENTRRRQREVLRSESIARAPPSRGADGRPTRARWPARRGARAVARRA
jgi:CubicO group peptidase (beta-lactamase class C family)